MDQTTHVRVGDPDPNPAEREAAGDPHTSCAAIDRPADGPWACTRPPDHGGPVHIAGNGGEVCHVWPT